MDLQGTLDGLVASGAESGLQVAAYLHGRPLVEAYAGVPGSGSLIHSFSVGKGCTAHCPARPDPHRRDPAAAARADPYRAVRLGHDVRSRRRGAAAVGAGFRQRVPRLDVRVGARGDRAPGHRAHPRPGVAHVRRRTPRDRRRAVLRTVGVRSAPGRAAGGGRLGGVPGRAPVRRPLHPSRRPEPGPVDHRFPRQPPGLPAGRPARLRDADRPRRRPDARGSATSSACRRWAGR